MERRSLVCFLSFLGGWSNCITLGPEKIFALSMKFVVIYVVGCLFLVIDALRTGNFAVWILNLAPAVLEFLAGYYSKKARL